MAVPALPADVTDGNATSAAHQNTILDHTQWWRDTRPLFQGSGITGTTISTATFTEYGHGLVSATFHQTPLTNTGTFTVASTTNADGAYNVEVTDAGIYEGFWGVQFASNATGRREAAALKNGESSAANQAIRVPAVSGNATEIAVPFAFDCAAGDELSVTLYQNSGGVLAVTPWLYVKWVQST